VTASDPLAPPRLALTTATLDNGLRVVVHRDPATVLAAVNLWYGVGSRDEEEGRTGFAHLFEHMMFQGSANVASGDHFKLLEAVGASLNATTWLDRTNYFETVALEHLDLALWLEADRMGSLAVTQDNLDNQREVVKEEKRQRYDNQPAGTLWVDILEGLFDPTHPYGHPTIGSMADLDAATLEDVTRFHDTWYGPDNAVLTVVADLDPEDVVARVERYFGGIDPLGGTPPVPEGSLERLALDGREERTIVDRVVDPVVCTAWRIPAYRAPGHDAAQLALAVLGYGRGSRLSRALTVDAELVSPSSRFTAGMEFTVGASVGYGRFQARAGVAAERVAEAVLAELQRMTTDPPGDDEVDRARALFAVDWLDQLGDVTARADNLSRIAQLLGDPQEIDRELEGVLAVTTEEVVAAAEELLAGDAALVLSYVPEEAS
jgi:zinc protease